MKKVLVVEDEISIANYLNDLIESLGYECRLLTSGKDVVETVKTWKPHLITLDLVLPAPSGLELLEMLKADPQTKVIPIFIVSAIVKHPGVSRQLKLAERVFEKPLDTKFFIKELQKVCAL